MSGRRIPITFLLMLSMAAVAAVAGAATLEVAGPPGASVSINGRAMGFFPLDGPLDVPASTFTIRCELQGYAPFEQSVTLIGQNDWRRVQVRMIRLSRKTAWTSNILFAGLGQHYMGASFRGYVYNVVEAGGLITALVAELNRSNLANDYELIQDQYNTAVNANDVTEFKEQSQQTYDDMIAQEDLRNNALLVAAGAIVVSMADALLFFPSAEVDLGPVPVDTESYGYFQTEPSGFSSFHAGLRWEF